MTYRKKLIEVSLPLEAINKEAAREKSIRHGHPSTLHLWWARRPLAACRAVLFSSLVDDPSEYMPDEESARVERERLFDIIEELVKWENSNNEEVLDRARLEIARSVAQNLGVDVPVGKEAVREFLVTNAPPVLDPFAGGGSIPLEAQRLGLRTYASDLNPVAVLINKALIEIPPKFANMPPVHPDDSVLHEETTDIVQVKGKKGKKKESQPSLFSREWNGAQGLAEDVRYYGQWMRAEALKRIGHLYPPVTITKEILAERSDLKEQGYKEGDQLTVIAWLWARTVKCPNPACGGNTPLIKSFSLSTKKGKEVYIQPIVQDKKVTYKISRENRFSTTGSVSRNGAVCLICNTPIPFAHIRTEGQSKRIFSNLISIATEGKKGRVFFAPNKEQELKAHAIAPKWKPETELQGKAAVNVPLYGLKTHGDLFSDRQLNALITFLDIARFDLSSKIETDFKQKHPNSEQAQAYSNAIITYLSFTVSKALDYWSNLCVWRSDPKNLGIGHVFARQALQMVWDFAEANPFSNSSGNWENAVERTSDAIEGIYIGAGGVAKQNDTRLSLIQNSCLLSTDPPYYDNISYADLSDFFYIWLRYILQDIYPDIFLTLAVPKSGELVATPYRFEGNKEKAESFFESGLRDVFRHFLKTGVKNFPYTIYYAFKQSENESDDTDTTDTRSSTGWETMLSGLIESGFQISGTWPIRTEMENRSIASGANALASSIVLVCRPRPEDATSCSRREFLGSLKKELAPALRELQQGSIAPVDLAQASIGPGMAVYSRYSAVLEADGKPMSVRTALGLINQALDEYLTEQEGEYDGDTRWALSWFEQFGHNEAAYGVAETLSKAKNTSVEGLAEAGILEARAGKVRILRRDELDIEWDPTQDKRLTAWEACQHLIYALENEGEEAAAALLSKLGQVTEPARDLAYRLYTVCERKGWAQDALGYNSLVVAWPRLKELAAKRVEPGQGKLM